MEVLLISQNATILLRIFVANCQIFRALNSTDKKSFWLKKKYSSIFDWLIFTEFHCLYWYSTIQIENMNNGHTASIHLIKISNNFWCVLLVNKVTWEETKFKLKIKVTMFFIILSINWSRSKYDSIVISFQDVIFTHQLIIFNSNVIISSSKQSN